MKKNSGFMLFETLIVSTLVLGTLIFLYVQIVNIKKSYNVSFKYNTIPGLYNANALAKYLEKTGYSDIKSQLEGANYVDITDCASAGSLCYKIVEKTNIKQALFVNSNITNLKTELDDTSFNRDLKKYIRRLPDNKENYNYRLIIEFNDNTFASVPINKDYSDMTAYNLVNLIKNSNFETNTSNWLTTGGSNVISVSDSIKKSGEKSLNITLPDSSVNKIYQNVSLTKDHVYYFSDYVYLTELNGFSNITLNNYEYANVAFDILKKKRWNKISSVFIPTKTGNHSINVANVSSINSINIDDVLLIDLTSVFGTGNEPTKEWCDENIKYFENRLTIYK